MVNWHNNNSNNLHLQQQNNPPRRRRRCNLSDDDHQRQRQRKHHKTNRLITTKKPFFWSLFTSSSSHCPSSNSLFGGSHHSSSPSSIWHLLNQKIRSILVPSSSTSSSFVRHYRHQLSSFSSSRDSWSSSSFTSNHNCNFHKMYTIGRSSSDHHHHHCEYGGQFDFRSEENLQKWRGFFVPTLQQIQQHTHPSLIARQDGLQYVESFILKLLGLIISTNGSVGSGGPSIMSLHTTTDVEDRIRRLIPDPLKTKAIKKAKEILSALRNSKKSKANSLFHGNDRQPPLKTPVDKFHQLLQKEVLFYKTDVQVSQYLLAVLEFIATDILQLAGHYVRNMINTEITSQDIRVAMCADKFLMEIFSKDEDEVDVGGPPLSANCYYHQSFFDTDFMDGEYGNIGNHSNLTYSEAVHEFIQEEKQFIRELSLIIKVFRDPLATSGILTEDDLQKIFVNIDDIYEFSIKFLGLLEDAVEVADEDDCPAISSCFIEIAEDEEMDVFHKYAQNVMNFSFRDHLYYVLSQHSLQSQITELFSTLYNVDFLAVLKYVLPRLLLLPVYHCFSYFKAIEKLKELTPSLSDKENYAQADSTLQSLRNVLEKQKKSNKFGDGYFLRLYGRTNRATQMAKMKEIQTSIDNWNGKDIWQCCNEFIREGVLYKVSNPGKSISHFSNSERRAFLFDGLLVLCKPCTNKRIVPGRNNDNSHQLEWRCKERFFIRNIEIIERDEPYVRSNFSLFNFTSAVGHTNTDNSNTFQPNSMLDQSLCSLSNSVSNISISNDGSTIHAFEVSQPNQNQPIVLMTKTAEEKDSWMSQLILLNMRSILERSLDAKLTDEAKKHPWLLPHPSVYRFAIEDMESNIILEENKSNQNVPLIKGATLLKLIERLTYHKYGDPVLVKIFLTTYRSFCTPTELLKLLIERFEIPEPDFRSCMQAMHYANNDELASPTSMAPPQQELSTDDAGDGSQSNTGPTSPTSPTMFMNHQSHNNSMNNSSHLPATPLSASDLNQIFFDEQDEQCQQDYREMLKRFRKEYAQPVQFRVLNVLRHWIDKHWYDFERDRQLLDMLNEFLNEKLAKSHIKVAKWCHHIRSVIDRAKNLQKTAAINDQSDGTSIINFPIYDNNNQQRSPINILPNHFNSDEFDLLTFPPKEIATHLTLFEFELYKAVQPYELVGMDDQSLVWTKKDKQKTSPNLIRMMKHHSIMSYYFQKCIIETENFEERCAIVTRIVEILIHLKSHNNFNGVSTIVAAFSSASVHRLEHTLAHIERNSKLKKNFEQAKELMDDHFKRYKEELFSINPPCVPFMGNFLTNIVHLEEGNPEYLSPPSNADDVSCNASSSNNLSANDSHNQSSNQNNHLQCIQDDVATTKLINFQKKRRVAETISAIQQYQNEPYSFKANNPTIWNFFQNLDSVVFNGMEDLDDNERKKKLEDHLFTKSLEIEPRNLKQPPKFPRKWPDRNLKQTSKTRNIRLPGIPGISHQSQSSFSESTNNNSKSHHQHSASASHINLHNNNSNNGNHSLMMDNQSMIDTISLQQQQSPTLTPTTPPAGSCHDAIFAPVMIGGVGTSNNNGNTSAHISPTTPASLHTSFFPSSFTTHHHHQHSSPHPQHPPPSPGPFHQHQNSLPSPLISPPSSAAIFNITNSETSTPTVINNNSSTAIAPPLPPRNRKSELPPKNKCKSESPPPLPPKTYKHRFSRTNSGTSTGKIPSYRDKGPPPLPRMPPPIISNHYHQRVNSDIVSSSTTSPNNNNIHMGPTIVRRNSTMDNSTTLLPKKYSQSQPPPLPPTPLTTSPKTPNNNNTIGNTMFNSLLSPIGHQQQPSSPSSPKIPSHPPPAPSSPNPPVANATTALAAAAASANVVPELPPKTYRLSNGHCR